MRLRVETTVQQIKDLAAQGVTTFTFADEDFIGNDPGGAFEIASRLTEIPNLDFALSVRADNIFDPDKSDQENAVLLKIFQTLKQAGLTLVFIGAESFAPTQLHRYGKGSTAKATITSIHLMETLGIELELGLILFDPLVIIPELKHNVTTLQQTGFWNYAGQLFSFMRVQKGTPYEKLLAKQGLLGSLNPDMLEFATSYQSAEVAQIASFCRDWNAACNPLYQALRNINRSELGTGHYHSQVLAMRQAQLDLLEVLLSLADPYGEDAQHAYEVSVAYMHNLADEVTRKLAQQHQLTIGEKALQRAALKVIEAENVLIP